MMSVIVSAIYSYPVLTVWVHTSSEMHSVRQTRLSGKFAILNRQAAHKPYNQDEVIRTYKRLIRTMPRANQYLLLYVLDLLSVFARKSDKNLMTAKSAWNLFTQDIHPDTSQTWQ